MLRVKKGTLENETRKPTRASKSSNFLQEEKAGQHSDPGSTESGLRRVP